VCEGRPAGFVVTPIGPMIAVELTGSGRLHRSAVRQGASPERHLAQRAENLASGDFATARVRSRRSCAGSSGRITARDHRATSPLTPDDGRGHEPASHERSRDEDTVILRIDHARGGFRLAAATRVPHSRIVGLHSVGSMSTSISQGPSWSRAVLNAAANWPSVLAWRPRPDKPRVPRARDRLIRPRGRKAPRGTVGGPDVGAAAVSRPARAMGRRGPPLEGVEDGPRIGGHTPS
jgi:hypothetical protein